MNCGNIVIVARKPRWNVGNPIELQLRYFKACHTHSRCRPLPFLSFHGQFVSATFALVSGRKGS